MVDNDSFVTNSHRVFISADESLHLPNGIYKNIEQDDVISQEIINNDGRLGNTKEWTTSNKRSRYNHDKDHVNNYINLKRFEHPNRFTALRNTANEVIENNCDVDNQPIYQNVQPSNNHKIRHRPHVIAQSYPENNFIKMPIRPGVNTYNQAVKDGKKP